MKSNINYLFTAISFLLAQEAMAQNAQFTHSPAQTEVQVGDTFAIDVLLDAANATVSVYDIHMRFDSEFLEVVSLELADNGYINHLPPSFSNTHGRIDLAAMKFDAVNINGTIPTLKVYMRALAATELTELYHPQNSFPTSLIAFNGEDIMDGAGSSFITISAGEVLSVGENIERLDLSLSPNPTASESVLTLRLKESSQVDLAIYDVAGKRVEQLFEGELNADVDHRFTINAARLANGTYACRLIHDSHITTALLIVAH